MFDFNVDIAGEAAKSETEKSFSEKEEKEEKVENKDEHQVEPGVKIF